MQFEPPASPYPPNPFSPYGYYPTPPPQGFAGARPHFYDSLPTPAASPRAPHHSRRRSHDYNGEFPGMRRAATHETHPTDFGHDYPNPPPRPHTRAGATYIHTPLHTPPPTSHGAAPQFFSSYVPGYSQQPEYVSSGYGHHTWYHPSSDPRDPQFSSQFGPQSPPPRDRTRSARSHRREFTWAAGEGTPRSPPRPSPRRAKTAAQNETAPDYDEARTKAAEHGIPSDYSLKNWDPKERPIILLGSVFDANSLGEWIFNWTKFHHTRHHEATKVAGQLWELLIALGGKLKRAREFVVFITRQENREIVEDFMENGERLWQKLKALLLACEKYMWNGAKSSEKGGYQMGRKSGAEFVEAMFSAEKEWENTEKLMRGVKTWCDRFEVNCEDILRNPNA